MIKINQTLISLLLITNSLFAINGEEVFKNNCTSCHIMKMGWQLTAEEKMTMQGPPAFGITRHVRDAFSNEKEFVEFVSNYITKPSKVKSKCKDWNDP